MQRGQRRQQRGGREGQESASYCSVHCGHSLSDVHGQPCDSRLSGDVPVPHYSSTKPRVTKPFSEHEVGFFPTGGVASFPDCSAPTFDGTLKHVPKKGSIYGTSRVARVSETIARSATAVSGHQHDSRSPLLVVLGTNAPIVHNIPETDAILRHFSNPR